MIGNGFSVWFFIVSPVASSAFTKRVPEPILVHWPVCTQIGFFACMSVDYANKKSVKPDENWFKVIAKAICKPTVQVSNFTHIQGTADRAAEDEEEAD